MSVELSALVVPVPEADPVVGPYRAALDTGAALGMPAHVTILYPFMPTSALDHDAVAELRRLFASIDAFAISLTSIAWFDHAVVYVRPEPDAALRQITARVAERWPQWPPYEGSHADPTPHLTLADSGDLSTMRQAAQAVAESLPIHVDVSEVQLYAGTTKPDSWNHRLTFPLRTGQS